MLTVCLLLVTWNAVIFDARAAKILTGPEAQLGQFPWEAHIIVHLKNATVSCTGSLVAVTYVLSAAHCFDNLLKVTVILGHKLKNQKLERGKVIYPGLRDSNIHIHPSYHASHSFLKRYDIALVKLPIPVKPTNIIKPIRLAFTDDDMEANYIDIHATVIGWGLNTRYEGTKVLRYGRVTVLNNSACLLVYPKVFKYQDNRLLCGVGQDTIICSGDSGGALFYLRDGQQVQIGISAFIPLMNPCLDNTIPQGYVRVAAHMQWIQEVMHPSYALNINSKMRPANDCRGVHFKTNANDFKSALLIFISFKCFIIIIANVSHAF